MPTSRTGRPKCQSSDSVTLNATAFISVVRCVFTGGENKEERTEKVVVLAEVATHFLLRVVGKYTTPGLIGRVPYLGNCRAEPDWLHETAAS